MVLDSSFSGGKRVRPQQVVQLSDGSFVVSGFLQETGQTIVQQIVARYSPLVSNLNTVRAGQTVANAAIGPLGVDDLALFTQSGRN